MSKGIYVGVPTEVPIYEETVTELEPLTYSTSTDYFVLAPYSGGYTLSASPVMGGLRFGAGNIGTHSSTGGIAYTAKADLKNVKVYCEYCTEKSWDKVTVVIAGTTVMDEVSGTDNTALNLIWSGDLAAGEAIDCKYVKDTSTHASGEKVYWEIVCDPLIGTTQEIVGYETKELARKVKKPYIEVEGLARKVKKGYIGVEGVARQFYAGEAFGGFSGDYTVSQVELDGVAYNLYTLTSSGTLDLGEDAQFWMCGGGSSGYASVTKTTSYNAAIAGDGGCGGYVETGIIAPGTYAVIIGAGNNSDGETVFGGDTSIGDAYIALGGGTITDATKGHQGGSGGGGGGYAYPGGRSETNGRAGSGVSTIPFGIESLKKHCAGGSGGSSSFRDATDTWSYANGGDGGSNGSDGYNGGIYNSDTAYYAGVGGEYGGGNGGYSGVQATSATFYGGGGGGARVTLRKTDTTLFRGTVGAGYQGVCYILIPISA